MEQGNAILNLTIKAAVALIAGQFVTIDGQVATATNAHGVVVEDAAVGELVAVTVLGTAVVKASGAIKLGQSLKVGTNGTVTVASGTDKVVAVALADAADTGMVKVLLRG